METKDVLLKLRAERGYTQDALAEKVFVTRQAVSRWETGETVPGIETLKLLSKLYGVSINTLLGAPRRLICQCCGMPLDDGSISREADGAFNEDYCKWCYANGRFAYESIDQLTDYLAEHFAGDASPEQAHAFFREQLLKLRHWRRADED